MIGEDWDLPRLNAWNKSMGRLPPLQLMVGRYLGYELPKAEETPVSMEEAAERLIQGLTRGMG